MSRLGGNLTIFDLLGFGALRTSVRSRPRQSTEFTRFSHEKILLLASSRGKPGSVRGSSHADPKKNRTARSGFSSRNFENPTASSVLVSAETGKNRTEPDCGNTTARSTWCARRRWKRSTSCERRSPTSFLQTFQTWSPASSSD